METVHAALGADQKAESEQRLHRNDDIDIEGMDSDNESMQSEENAAMDALEGADEENEAQPAAIARRLKQVAARNRSSTKPMKRQKTGLGHRSR